MDNSAACNVQVGASKVRDKGTTVIIIQEESIYRLYLPSALLPYVILLILAIIGSK